MRLSALIRVYPYLSVLIHIYPSMPDICGLRAARRRDMEGDRNFYPRNPILLSILSHNNLIYPGFEFWIYYTSASAGMLITGAGALRAHRQCADSLPSKALVSPRSHRCQEGCSRQCGIITTMRALVLPPHRYRRTEARAPQPHATGPKGTAAQQAGFPRALLGTDARRQPRCERLCSSWRA